MTTTKSRRVLSILLAIVMVLSLNTVFCFQVAHAEHADGWDYTLDSAGKATLTGYSGTETAIKVPAKIDGHSVVCVSSVCTTASMKKRITSITISSGIKEISPNTFKGYTKLTSVRLPATLKTIGSSAFWGCTALASISIPTSVSELGDSAFLGCTSLNSISLGAKVKEIPSNVFSGCTSLRKVSISDNCTSIGEGAFNNCVALSSVYLPDSITEIGANAFNNCKAIKGELTLPVSVKTIGATAFANCTGITKIIVPNKAKDIESSAFLNCSALTEAYFGEKLDSIGRSAFEGCTSLTKVVFGGEYVNLSSVFGNSAKDAPTVYYPSNLRSSWDKYSGEKKSYSAPTSISLSGNKSTSVGKSTTIKATVTPNTSSVGSLCFFSTSNPNIATVNSKGIVTGKGGGNVTITATTINGVSRSVTVKVVPKTVSGLKVAAVTTSSVKVSWTKASNVTGYIVYRSTTPNGVYSKVTSTLSNSFTDKGLTKGKTYYYKVRAYVTSGGKTFQSVMSSYKSITVTAPAPKTIKGTKYSSGTARIQWSKAIGAEGYQVAYATSPNGKFYSAKVITSGSSLSLRKGGLTPGKTYYFKVRSYITVNGKRIYSDFTNTVAVKV